MQNFVNCSRTSFTNKIESIVIEGKNVLGSFILK